MLLQDLPEVVPVIQTDSLSNRVFDQLDAVAEVHLLVAVSFDGGLVLHLLEEDRQVELVWEVLWCAQERNLPSVLDRLHGLDLEPPSLGA